MGGERELMKEGLGVDKLQKHESFYSLGRDRLLARAEIAAERFKETKTFEFPTWQYGGPIGTLFKLEVEDCPNSVTVRGSKWTAHALRFLLLTCKWIFAAGTGTSTSWGMIYPSLRQFLSLSGTALKQYEEPM